jgi:hypothetical protein
MDSIKYFRRRQFVLGPAYFEFDGWDRVELGPGDLLTKHPDLPLTRVRSGANSLSLLGYCIDPFNPDRGDQEILSGICEQAPSLPDLIKLVEKLTGRFVLIAALGADRYVLHDAVALRQVNYCRHQGSVWCASQAEALAERFGFALDSEVLSYRDYHPFKAGTEFWLLNDRTPYREIRNLLPNHFLDVRQGKAIRHWPKKGCIPALSMDESLSRCTPVLVGAIAAASSRFDLRMGISAGIDSRKTLAATRDVRGKIYYFSHGISEGTLNVSDVTVPARLLPRLGLEHHALHLRGMDKEFKRFFEASSTWAREKKGKNACTLLAEFGPETTVMNSNISEVAQCIYWLPKSRLRGEGLAILCGLAHPFAIQEFQKWLDGAKPACEEARMNVLDLFFLEQRMGRWATAAFSEYDVAHETFNPYNNRYLHSLMLGVKERYRRDRMWTVSLKHIKEMWPDVLAEPINPQDTARTKVQQFIRRFIVHKTIAAWLPLYPYLRFRKKLRKFERLQCAQEKAC